MPSKTDGLVSTSQLKIALLAVKDYLGDNAGGSDDIPVSGVKTFSEDYKTVTTVYENGNRLVKTFSDDMKKITSVLKDSNETVIYTEVKTMSDDGLTFTTEVTHGDPPV